MGTTYETCRLITMNRKRKTINSRPKSPGKEGINIEKPVKSTAILTQRVSLNS